jgi:uncharacterized protein (DUF2141 family)
VSASRCSGAFGQYAAVVYHDLDSNGVLDHGWFGPKEPLGFSGGWKLSLLSGMPTFEKLRFDFSPAHREVDFAIQ